ncbi:MAG: hypothetical protein ACPGXZ_02260 [Saprospiraceae bacterium]
MLRNDYPITRLVGASIIALDIMFFSFFYQDLMRQIRGQYFVLNTEWQLTFLALSTVLAIGVGLIFRQKWARVLFVVFLFVFVLGWLFLLISTIRPNRNDSMIFIGGTTFILTFAASLVFLLYNKKLNDEFDEEIVENIDDTLDSQLFN